MTQQVLWTIVLVIAGTGIVAYGLLAWIAFTGDRDP